MSEKIDRLQELKQLLADNNITPLKLSKHIDLSRYQVSDVLSEKIKLTEEIYQSMLFGINKIIKLAKPKKEKEVHKASVESYIIHSLRNHFNVVVGKKKNIKDLLNTLENDFGMACTYVLDKDGDYIIHLENHVKASDKEQDIDVKAQEFIEKIKAMNLNNDDEIVKYIRSISSPEELRGFIKGMVITKISLNQINEVDKFVGYFMEASK